MADGLELPFKRHQTSFYRCIASSSSCHGLPCPAFLMLAEFETSPSSNQIQNGRKECVAGDGTAEGLTRQLVLIAKRDPSSKAKRWNSLFSITSRYYILHFSVIAAPSRRHVHSSSSSLSPPTMTQQTTPRRVTQN